jgi:hypothetical protein
LFYEHCALFTSQWHPQLLLYQFHCFRLSAFSTNARGAIDFLKGADNTFQILVADVVGVAILSCQDNLLFCDPGLITKFSCAGLQLDLR